MLKNLDYKVKKSEDCALININNWVQPSEIEVRKINGKASISCITQALDVNYCSDIYEPEPINPGDSIFITKVAAEIASMRSYDLGDGQKYYNIPLTQILGVFKKPEISFDSLEMVYNKILVEKIDVKQSSLYISNNNMIGKIVKIGSTGFTRDLKLRKLRVKLGDIVIIKDNIATEIRLNDKMYYALEENNVVGIIGYGFSLADVTFINESILMKPYINPNILNSSILITPDINYEDLDYSDIYNRNAFQIEYLDEDIEGLSKGDIVIVKRDFTNYVYFNQEKYFLLNGKEWIETKIIE